MMNTNRDEVQRLLTLANHLGELCDDLVFLGGAVLCLLVDDEPRISRFRPTVDVDATAEIHSLLQFYAMQERLRKRGFVEVADENSVICRYQKDSHVIDIVPTSSVLGFTNCWFADAYTYSNVVKIESVRLRVISPVFFLASKIEAFRNRGQDDYLASHDLEDFVAVCDGKKDIVKLVSEAPFDVRMFLKNETKRLLSNDDFVDSLPGHLSPDPGSQSRIDLLESRLFQMSVMSD